MLKIAVPERRACKILSQARLTQRHNPISLSDEKQLTEEVITLATKHERYGYRRIGVLLNYEKGWRVNHERIERIRRREEPKVPKKQPKQSRLRLIAGFCIRLRPEHKNHLT